MIRNNQDKQIFIRQFNSECDEYCEQKENQLRQPVESINNHMVRLIDQYK